MKLIIDIDEAKYETFLNDMYSGMTDADLFSAIKNGTPIPDNEKQDEAITTLKNTAWLGTEDDRAKVDEAISALERQSDIEAIRAEIDGLLNDEDNPMYEHGVMDCLDIIDKHMKGAIE